MNVFRKSMLKKPKVKPQDCLKTQKKAGNTDKHWSVYMLRCADGTLYTGVTTDLERRLRQHNGAILGGARYTRGRRPVTLVYHETHPDQATACQREAVIKKLTRVAKERLLLISA
ncbi:MAG: GIY-YIG nuclease family protein [Saccharospirillum sp.]